MVLSGCRLIGLDDPCRPEKISKIDLSQRNFFSLWYQIATPQITLKTEDPLYK
jgi:hypothetical protein